MPEPTVLTDAVTRLAERLRAMPQSALQQGSAAEALVLAGEFARRAQRLEFPDQEPQPLPDAGVFAVGDQLAVVGHDLAEALRISGDTAELDDAVRLVEDAAPRVTARR